MNEQMLHLSMTSLKFLFEMLPQSPVIFCIAGIQIMGNIISFCVKTRSAFPDTAA